MSGYRFASPQWLAAIHGIIVERARNDAAGAAAGIRFSMCEVFENAPADISDEARRIVWSCVVEGNAVDFRLEERDDVGLKLIADYDACLPLATFDTRGEPERRADFERRFGEEIARGTFRIVMAPGGLGAMGSIHDAAAALTAEPE